MTPKKKTKYVSSAIKSLPFPPLNMAEETYFNMIESVKLFIHKNRNYTNNLTNPFHIVCKERFNGILLLISVTDLSYR